MVQIDSSMIERTQFGVEEATLYIPHRGTVQPSALSPFNKWEPLHQQSIEDDGPLLLAVTIWGFA
jgi:hypothetical protein